MDIEEAQGNGVEYAKRLWDDGNYWFRRTDMNPKRYKVRDVLQLLRHDGWVLLRSKGSHQQFAHPVKNGVVTISYHSGNDDLHPKTLVSILRQAGLTRKKR